MREERPLKISLRAFTVFSIFTASSRSLRITDGFRLAFKHADQLVHARGKPVGKRSDTDCSDRGAVRTENGDTDCSHSLHQHVEEYRIAALARALHFIFEPCQTDVRILRQPLLYQRQDGLDLGVWLPCQKGHR